MSSTPPKPAKSAEQNSKQQVARNRSSAALRKNLKRRKTQARQQVRTVEAQDKSQTEDAQ